MLGEGVVRDDPVRGDAVTALVASRATFGAWARMTLRRRRVGCGLAAKRARKYSLDVFTERAITHETETQ